MPDRLHPHPPRRWSRRDTLKLSGSSLVAAATAPVVVGTTASAAPPPPPAGAASPGRGAARNVILLIADGMSPSLLSIAQPFAERVRDQTQPLHWIAASRRPDAAAGLYDCGSANALVTDSAAAASAWSCGTRVDNGRLNVTPDGRALTPIAEPVQATGRRVGLVTTTRLTHATPAAFAAVHRNRNAEDDIATQFPGRADVLLGGGLRHFTPNGRDDGEDLVARYRDAGYAYWSHRDAVMRLSDADRVLGLFSPSHLPYTIDHRGDDALSRRVPTLEDMTRAALRLLARDDRGFLLQVEGGRVDHACHANDAAAALWDLLAFDDALGAALEFADGRRDTLVIVTTDHGNATPALNGMGPAYRETDGCFDRLARANRSFDWLQHQDAAGVDDPSVLADAVARHLGVRLSDGEARRVARAWREQPGLDDELNAQHRSRHALLAQALGNHTGVQFTGVSHTADWAPLHAVGPGAAAFAGHQLNTDLHRHMAAAMSLASVPS